VLSGKTMASALTETQKVNTVNGLPVIITKSSDGVVKFASAMVTSANVLVTNGVIHAIDTVVLPPAAPTTAEVTTTGKVEMKMSSEQATALKAKPAEAKKAFGKAIAKTINVDAAKVTITDIYVDDKKVGGTRRLADSTVRVDWSVKADKRVDAAAMVPATLKTNV